MNERHITSFKHSDEYEPYYAFVDNSESMEQSGVIGMEWGKRRWQYKDGSLTPEGRDHYGVGAPREHRTELAKRMVDTAKRQKEEIRKERAKKNVEKHLYRKYDENNLNKDQFSDLDELIETTGSRKKAAEELVKNMVRADLDTELSKRDFRNMMLKRKNIPTLKQHQKEIESLLEKRLSDEKYQDMMEYMKNDYFDKPKYSYDISELTKSAEEYYDIVQKDPIIPDFYKENMGSKEEYVNKDVKYNSEFINIKNQLDPDDDAADYKGRRYDGKYWKYDGKHFKDFDEITEYVVNGKDYSQETKDPNVIARRELNKQYDKERKKRWNEKTKFTPRKARKEAVRLQKMMDEVWEKRHSEGKLTKKQLAYEKKQLRAHEMFMAHPEYYINEDGRLYYGGRTYPVLSALLDEIAEHI